MHSVAGIIEPTVPLLIVPGTGADRPAAEALEAEWLLTNGLGGFALGTAAGVNTRRYHGLLNVATRPPAGRVNLLNGVVDSVTIDGVTTELATHEFAAGGGGPVFHPKGCQHLHRFERDTAARWHYRVGAVSIVKELRLVWRRNLAVLRYRIAPAAGEGTAAKTAPPGRVTLTVRPLVALRDFHQLPRGVHVSRYTLESSERGVIVHAPDAPPLHMAIDDGAWRAEPTMWYGFHRRAETERGQDDAEDLLCAGAFEQAFDGSGGELVLCFGAEPIDPFACHGDDGRRAHLGRLAAHVRGALPDEGRSVLTDGTIGVLAQAADDFVVERRVAGEALASVIAGYPWFADWGRDTMIALRGLLLTTGRFDDARRTLAAYARHIRRGLVPNRFDDYGGEPHYNTVDAALWFIHAALEYRRLTDDAHFWADVLIPACQKIVDFYQSGTDGDIHMDDDGLISAGNPDTQLTWMDAKRDGVVFTPRHGKCVEINALWHRALIGCAEFDPSYGKLARRVRASFNAVFWDDGLGYLLDHVNAYGADRSLRPNQVIAVALPESPLDTERQRAVMRAVRERLLTPMGLRTLPTDDPQYHGRYTGTMWERDAAYHRGTVWPWLIGPYVEGYLRAHAFSDDARGHCRGATGELLAELGRHALGQLHEVYDGDPPHRPGGCPAQAWSVAETLRAVVMIESPGPPDR